MPVINRTGLTAIATVIVPMVALLAAGPAHAGQITIDFESPGGYDLFYGATVTTAQALSATHSVQLSVPSDPVDAQQLVRISPSGFKLGQIAGSFSAYLPSGGTLAPYMEFGVDANHNGVWDPGNGDALVIAFVTGAGSYPGGTWFQAGLDQSTLVHVVDGRPGLADGTYSSSGTQDTLGSLVALPLGDLSGQSWGDLNVMRAYVTVGEWPGVTSYTSYIDNIQLNEVPEPGSLALLASSLGFAGWLRRRRTGK